MIHQGAAPISDFTSYEITFDLFVVVLFFTSLLYYRYFLVRSKQIVSSK